MDIDIKKNGKIKLKDTPYFEPIDNTNISFSNMDVGTAMLTFQIKKNGLPLQVSKKNVYVYCYLESRNGTRSEVIELDVVDALQGKASLQLDSEFLIGATNSTVDGQLYITMHKFNDVPDDFSDTVALQEFTFTVKDALINEISGVTKTQYIRTFDQLRTEVKEKIKEMQENIGNIETLVDRVKQASQDAINKVNDTKDAMIKDMQAQYDSTETELIELRESSIQKLELSATNYINDIKNAKDELVQMISDENLITTQTFEEFTSDFREEIETRLDEYEKFVSDTQNDFTDILATLDWQKYKLSDDDGNNFVVGLGGDVEKLRALKPGNYYLTSTPIKGASSTAGYATITTRQDFDNLKHIVFRPYNSTQMWLMRFYNEWFDWEEITNTQDDTGWVPFQLINDTLANDAFKGDGGFECAYRIITNGSVTEKSVRINAKNIVGTQQIATLPEGFAKNPQFHLVRAPIHRGQGLIGIFPTGSVYAYVETEQRDNWTKDDYFYGEFSWKE